MSATQVAESEGKSRGHVLFSAPYKQPEWYEVYAGKSILGRWAQLHEMVEVAVFLSSGTSSHVTGFFVLVDGGCTAIGLVLYAAVEGV